MEEHGLQLNTNNLQMSFISTLKSIVGLGPKIDFKNLLNKGALLVDVRSENEFASGHLKNAINIPVDKLSTNLHLLPNKDLPIITYCASGIRSSMGKRILAKHGYKTHNGGGYTALQQKLHG